MPTLTSIKHKAKTLFKRGKKELKEPTSVDKPSKPKMAAPPRKKVVKEPLSIRAIKTVTKKTFEKQDEQRRIDKARSKTGLSVKKHPHHAFENRAKQIREGKMQKP